MKLINFFSLLFFFNFISISCQISHNFTIKEVSEDNYKFPMIEGNDDISKKINTDIIKDLLGLDIEKEYKSIFRNVKGTEENKIPRLVFLEYQINTLNKKLYSITFESEGCGAYCEEFDISYNYDLSNGKKVMLDSVFTDVGRKTLLSKITRLKKNKIKNYISKLISEKTNKEEGEIVKSEISLFKNCLNNTSFNTLEYIDFKIKKDSIILTSGRCSNHAMRALDGLGDYIFKFKKEELTPLLNKYGKSLIL